LFFFLGHGLQTSPPWAPLTVSSSILFPVPIQVIFTCFFLRLHVVPWRPLLLRQGLCETYFRCLLLCLSPSVGVDADDRFLPSRLLSTFSSSCFPHYRHKFNVRRLYVPPICFLSRQYSVVSGVLFAFLGPFSFLSFYFNDLCSGVDTIIAFQAFFACLDASTVNLAAVFCFLPPFFTSWTLTC